MSGGSDDRVVIGMIGLEDDPPAQQAPARPPGHLGQQLERALAGAEVGQVEGGVGRDDADDGHQRQVEPLGDHLRADEDVGQPAAEKVEDGGVRGVVTSGVPVPA